MVKKVNPKPWDLVLLLLFVIVLHTSFKMATSLFVFLYKKFQPLPNAKLIQLHNVCVFPYTNCHFQILI